MKDISSAQRSEKENKNNKVNILMNYINVFWAIPYLRFSEHKFLLVQ